MFAAQGTHRVDVPINSIQRWGKGHFISEVKDLLESERKTRGYYPALPDIFDLITREFGADIARQARYTGLPSALRRRGICYSVEGAAEYHRSQVTGQPVLDMSAAFRLPYGTVQNYLYWKLPRLLLHDRFEVVGVAFQRVRYKGFSVTYYNVDSYQIVNRYVDGDSVSHAIARVLGVLRGDAVVSIPQEIPPLPAGCELEPLYPIMWRNEADRRRLSRLFRRHGYPIAHIAAALNVGQDVVQLDLLDTPQHDSNQAKPEAAPVSDAPPILHYRTKTEMQQLARDYLAKGYTMTEIQAALVRADD